jgi:hypothetical protein
MQEILNGLGWNRIASYFFSTWMELGWRLTNQKTESLSASICEKPGTNCERKKV